MICCEGFADSDAAIVAISAPRNANITPSIAPTTGSMPFGIKPCAVRLLMPLTSPSVQRLVTARPHTIRKQKIATTLIKANQNSNSP
ncbi:hypothetical protein D3C80_1623870 [compost metagenome]